MIGSENVIFKKDLIKKEKYEVKEISKKDYFLHHYKIVSKIGHGSFGDVYKGVYQNNTYAIKVDNNKSKLDHEVNIYYHIKIQEYEIPIPKIYFYGKVEYNLPITKDPVRKQFKEIINKDKKKEILVMEYLGGSLECLYQKFKPFTIPTILGIGIQIIKILKKVHDKNIIHRDIKPHNFLIGKKNKKKIFIIDFGISKIYRKNDKHIKYKEGKNLTGSLRYCSLRNHLGIEPSRRDDLESLCYMLILFFKGKLPWQGITKNIKDKKTKSENIKIKKLKTSIEELCYNCPIEMKFFIQYCRNLCFNEKPNYDYLISLFQIMLEKNKLTEDTIIYDWE